MAFKFIKKKKMFPNKPQKQIFILHPHFMNYGGASKVVLEFGSRLKKLGLDVKIVTTKTNPKVIQNYAELEFIPLSNLHTGNLFFWVLFPFFYFRLSNLLKKQKVKIIFSHSLAIYWGAVFKFFNKKIINVSYFHDLGLPYFDNKAEMEGLPKFSKLILRIVSPIFRLLNKAVIRKSDFIIANSNFTASEIQKKYCRKTDLVTYPAVDYAIFKPTEKKESYIYTLGRLEKIKNIDLIITAFYEYTIKYKDQATALKIIGQGIEKNSLINLCKKLNIENRVFFLGEMPAENVAEIASKAKIGLFFRYDEPFGIAAIESMACGTPVIGANHGGVAETVINKKTGLLSNPDKKVIADKINALLNDKQKLERLSENTRNHARENYDWDKSASRLYQFFIEL